MNKNTLMSFDDLEFFMVDVFKGLGVPEDEAAICAETLITADKRGIDSHGISRCKPIYYDRIKDGIQKSKTKIDVVRDRKAVAVLDGNNGMGHVIGRYAMNMAIQKAKDYGIGMVTVRNSTHYGIAGFYALMAAEANMASMNGTNARPSIAPTFGVENMLGTNPICYGFPTDEDFPFVLDCATSVTQRGKIEVYDRLGKDVPEGWVIGHDGKSRKDTNQILIDLVQGKAALTPLGGIGEDNGGYKGYGYATAVEVLSSAFQAGNIMKDLSGFDSDGKRKPIELGHFFIAINVDDFIEPDVFKKNAGNIMRALRDSKKAPGQERIYTAGEKEYEEQKKREAQGGIYLVESIQKEMIQMRDELKLNWTFPFEK